MECNQVIMWTVVLQKRSCRLVRKDLRCSVFQSVAVRIFWERHVHVDGDNFSGVVCYALVIIQVSYLLWYSPFIEISLVSKAVTGASASTEDMTMTFLI